MAAGTLSVTNNSKAVVGVGTTFTAFTAGDFLSLVVGQVPYTVAIASVESATALTLVLPFDGPTATGLAWDGVKRDTMSLATMGVTVQAQKALRLMIADENNWRAIFGDAEEITVTLPNGQVMQGMSWGYLSSLLKEVDPVEMRQIADQTITAKDQAQGFRNEAEGFKNTANSAKDAAVVAKTAAETAQGKAETAKTAAETAKTDAQSASTDAKRYRDEAEEWAQNVNAENLLTKSGNLAGLADLPMSRTNIGLGDADTVTHQSLRLKRNGSPYISLTNDAVSSSSIRNNMTLELNDDGVVRLYRRANDGVGPYTRLNFPQIDTPNNSEASLGLIGGLLWGDDTQASDFDDAPQGWSFVAGAVANGPIAGNNYGSCFSYCSQGLKEGGLPGSYNPKDVWWRQVYYNTSNVTYSRVNTNKGGWQPWSEYTMSAVSDERLKDVLGSLNVEGALDNINRMDFKLFRFKEERDPNKAPTVRRGVISQQLRGIDKEYTKLIGGYYHLDRTPMLLDGLAAIKALRARDEANKAEIAELKAAVEELQAAVAALTKA